MEDLNIFSPLLLSSSSASCFFYHLPLVFLLCSVTALTLSHVSALFLLFMMDHCATFAAGNALLTACIQVYVSSMKQRLLTCSQSDFWSKVHVKMPRKLILIKMTEPATAFQGILLSHFMFDLRCKHATTTRIFPFWGLQTRCLSHSSAHIY